MNCPHCTVTLEWKAGGYSGLNHCPKCRGLWLDRENLTAAGLDKDAPLAGDYAAIAGAAPSAIKCPSDGTGMVTISCLGADVDACPNCRGLWLDKGEWEKLAEAHRSSETAAPGIAAAAVVGGVAVAAGVALNPPPAAQAASSSGPYVSRLNSASNQGDVVCDIVESAAGDLFEGALKTIGSICSSIFD